MSTFGYADDIILLALCPFALRLMLKMCESFASSYGLQFNASKTQIIRFSLSPSNAQIYCCGQLLAFCNSVRHLGPSNAQIYCCGQLLAFCNSVRHLGLYLMYDLSDDEDIIFRSRDFLNKANQVFYNFKFCSSILTFLLHSLCLLLYGCALWHLDFKAITNIDVAFLRQIWNLHFDSQ